jgi:molybdenum cofactor cytidylyltransferase
MAEVAAVLLAAGASTRFGPGNKLVARIRARPLVRFVAETIAAGGVSEIVVVTGADAELIEGALEGIPVRFVHNARWQNGMGSSIAAGVSALSEEVQGVLIVPGDMPFVTGALLESLISAFERERGIIFPAKLTGEQRNPVLWPRRHFPLLTALRGQEGAKSLLKRYAGSCTAVTVADESVFADVDTVDDWAVARARAENC